MSRIARYFGVGLVAACLGVPGCASWDTLRGEGFNDSSSRTLRQYRQPDKETQFWGFSNKAREIEQDFGAH
jgi:hypothetical protein